MIPLSKATAVLYFGAKIPAFSMTLQRLRLPSCFAVFQRGNLLCLETRAFFGTKGSNSSEIGKE